MPCMGWIIFLNFCRFIVIYIYLLFFIPSAQRKAPAAGFSLAGALFYAVPFSFPRAGTLMQKSQPRPIAASLARSPEGRMRAVYFLLTTAI